MNNLRVNAIVYGPALFGFVSFDVKCSSQYDILEQLHRQVANAQASLVALYLHCICCESNLSWFFFGFKH